MKRNMVGWFEIPVSDMDRAKTFYEKVFKVKIDIQNFGEMFMGWFPFTEGKEGAAGTLPWPMTTPPRPWLFCGKPPRWPRTSP